MRNLLLISAIAFASSSALAGDAMSPRDVAAHIFAVADADEDTRLTATEFETSGMAEYGVSFSDMDTDGDGLVTEVEYLALYDRHHKPGEDA